MSVFDRVFGRNLVFPCAGVELGSGLTLTANSTLTTDSPRYTYLNATGGAFAVTLPGSTSGVYEGFTLYLCENAGSSNAVTVSAPGLQINGAASLVLNSPYRQVELRYNGTQYIVRAGTSTFDPTKPGPIGGTTPSTAVFQNVTLAGNAPTPVSAQPSLFRQVYGDGSARVGIQNDVGSKVNIGTSATTVTAGCGVDFLPLSLANNATYDYTVGNGGFAIVNVPAAASSPMALIGVTGNGAPTLNGATLAGGISLTQDNATTVNLYASGGKLRIQNKTGITVQVMLMFVGFGAG